jgi:hypothetical protein
MIKSIYKDEISLFFYQGETYIQESNKVDTRGRPYSIVTTYVFSGKRGNRFLYKLQNVDIFDCDEVN